MITVEKILFLQHVPLFSDLRPNELGRIASIAEEVIYPSGSTIIREGDSGDSMLVIVEGNVRIHHNGQEIAIRKEKEHIGEMSILDNDPRSASATALNDCLLLRIDRQAFHDILTRNNALAMEIIRTLSQRLREASG